MIPQKPKMNGENMAYNTIHMNSLQRCNVNNFGFIAIDMLSDNITKLVNRLGNNLFNEWTSPNTPKIEDISQNVSICENKNGVIAVAIARFLFLQSGALWLIYSFYGVLGEVQCIKKV